MTDEGAVVHGDVDVHLRPAGGAGSGRSLGGGLLRLPAAGALGLGLILVLGAVKQPLGHVHDGAGAGGQSQEEAAQDADDGAAHLGEQADKALTQQTAQGSAGL